MPAADLVLLNGPVFLADPVRSFARGVAVGEGRVLAVGTEAEVADLVGPRTEVVDLAGRLVCPGFGDAHVHPPHGGLYRLRCNLEDASGVEEALAVVAAYAAAHPEESWIRGAGWSFDWFPGGTPPATLLDQAVADRPVYLKVRDGHSAWVNSKALALAGLTTATPDPPDGRLERLPDGSPQGTLHEGAMRLLDHVMPPDTVDETAAGIREGQRHLLSLGVTLWTDAWVVPHVHAAYRRLALAGELRATVEGALWWERDQGLDQIEGFLAAREEATGSYRPGTVKLMLDGVVENFTAAMLDPYLSEAGDVTDNCGIDMIDPGLLKEAVTRLDALGFRCHFHAIGDRAVRNALDAVEAARVANGWSSTRHTIAHIQVIHPHDLPRFRRLGVIASPQPLWACNDAAMTDLTVPFLGERRAGWQYPFGSLAAQGAVLAMGSDWPVSSADVMLQIGVAVHRRLPDHPPERALLPHEGLRLSEALAGFTAGPAFAMGREADRGSLLPGRRGDLVVLDRDPFEAGIFGTGVDMTVVGGEVVHRREG